MIEAIDKPLLGIGMRNVIFALVILAAFGLCWAGIGKMKSAGGAFHNSECIFTDGIIFALQKWFQFCRLANRAGVEFFHIKRVVLQVSEFLPMATFFHTIFCKPHRKSASPLYSFG